MFTLLLVVIGIALLFDLVNGFHDAANSIATVVSTKVLTPLQAVIWAAFFNVLAFWVFDMSVGNTVAKTVDNTAIDLWVILAGLLAAHLVAWDSVLFFAHTDWWVCRSSGYSRCHCQRINLGRVWCDCWKRNYNGYIIYFSCANYRWDHFILNNSSYYC